MYNELKGVINSDFLTAGKYKNRQWIRSQCKSQKANNRIN